MIKTKFSNLKQSVGILAIALLLLGTFVFSYAATVLAADVPITMGYQGRLKDSGGTALSGTYDFTVRIYDALAGGNLEFTEVHSNITVTNGYFILPIGSVDPATNPLDLSFDETYYITTEVDSDGEMSPRTKINSAAYALRAGGIETSASDPTASSTSALREGRTYFNTGDSTLYVYTGGAWVAAGGGSGAPTDATYLVTSANATLSAEVVSSALTGNLTFAGNDAAARTITLGQTTTFDDLVVIDAGNWSVDSTGNATFNGNTVLGNAAADTVTVNGIIQGANALIFEGTTANDFETTFAVTDPTGDNTLTLPNASGTLLLSGHTFTGDVSATLDTDGSTALTIEANSVALTTDTTGNYVTSITNGSGIGGGDGGSEGAALTLALAALTGNWNQTGAFDIVLNNAGSELQFLESDGGASTGTLDVGSLAGDAIYTFSGTTGTVLTTANYAGSLDADYVDVDESPAAGDISGSFQAGLTIGANSVALGTDTTNNYVESANTSVLTGLTGGSSGSEGAALTLAFDYSQALSGSVGLAANATVFGVSGMVAEGGTADLIETFIVFTDPTSADKTITFPDRSGTLVLSSDTLTGDVTATFDTDGSTSTTIADNSVDGTDIALGSDTAGDIMYYNGTDWIRLAVGTPGQVLEVTAGGTAVEWDTDDTGAAASLQTAYDGDNSIETAGDLAVVIAETTGASTTGDLLQLTFTPATGGNTAGDALQITLDADDANGSDGNGINIIIDQSQNTGNAILVQDDAAGELFKLNEDGALTFGTLAATTAITIIDTDYTNAVSIADNNIIGTTAAIDFTNFDLSADGFITTSSTAAGDQITLTSGNANWQALVINAEATDVTNVDGLIDINVDFGDHADLVVASAIDINVGVADGATATRDYSGMDIHLWGTDTDADLFGLRVVAQSDNTLSGYEAALYIDNKDLDAGSMQDGLIVYSSGVENGVTDAIDISDPWIDHGLNLGANDIIGTAAVIDFTNFDVASTGDITVAAGVGLDTNAAGSLVLGNTTATSVSACNSAACDTLTLATNADADTVTIGDSLDTTAINSTGWSVTGAGALKVVSVDSNTATTLGIGNTTATALSLCNSAACDTITIGSNADADTITIGDAANDTAVSLNSTTWNIATTGVASFTATASQTTAIVITDTDYTNALSIGDNDITGTTFDLIGTTSTIDFTNFDVASSGAITVAAGTGLDTNGAGALALGNTNATSVSLCNSAACDTISIGTNADADAITIGNNNTTTSLALTSGTGDITLTSTDDIILALADNVDNALDIQQGTDNYINVNTTNSSENITLGNQATDPSISFLTDYATTSGAFRFTHNGDSDIVAGNEGIVYFDLQNASSTIPGFVINYAGSTATSNAFTVYDATSPFVVEANGEVGIGTSDPTTVLYISGSSFAAPADTVSGNGTAATDVLALTGTVGGSTSGTAVGTLTAGTGADGLLTFGTGGANTAAVPSLPGPPDVATGGTGGGLTVNGGIGGQTTGQATDTAFANRFGGTGGALTLYGGVGGLATDEGSTDDSSYIGGVGGAITIIGGTGGNATNSDRANTGGAGGGLVLAGGIGGTGADGGGTGGNVFIYGGFQGGGTTLSGDVYLGSSTDISSPTSSSLVYVNLVNASTAALCHGGGGGGTFAGLAEIQDCSGAPAADYMEMYPVSPEVETGDVVSIGETSVTTKDGSVIKQLVPSSSAYDVKVIGIASDPLQAGDFNSIGYNLEEQDNPYPIALNGRVPVKISATSDDIQPGDYLTSSTEPGKAMKATQPGQVIGKALDAWSSSSPTPTIMVFVTTTYADANNSSARYKTDVNGLTFNTEDLMRLRPVSFTWKNTGQQDVGFIAEEVNQVTPFLTYNNSTGQVEGVNYKLFAVVLTKAMQEQQLRIDNIASQLGLSLSNTNVTITEPTNTGQVTIDGQGFTGDHVGQARILAGATKVKVTFDTAYTNQPVVTITPTGAAELVSNLGYSVANTTNRGFELEINRALTSGITFNWHSFASPSARIFVSDGTTEELRVVIDDVPTPTQIVIDSGSSSGGDVAGDSEEEAPATDSASTEESQAPEPVTETTPDPSPVIEEAPEPAPVAESEPAPSEEAASPPPETVTE